MLIPYLLTFHWTKPLIFAWIVCIKMMRIPLRSLRMFFVICFAVATKESFFMFHNKFFKQIYCVAMGSPLGPAQTNIFMCSFEKRGLKDCSHSLNPVFYRWYVDDIFALFSSLDQAENLEKETDDLF